MGYFRLLLGGTVAGGLFFNKILYNDDGNKGKRRADAFLTRLYREISMTHNGKWKTEEIEDIKTAAIEMVHNILVKAYEGKMSEEEVKKRLIPVGSMEEGTKVLDPDEFDYSFVIPQFNDYEINEDLVFGKFSVHRQAKLLRLHNDKRLKQIIDKAFLVSDFSKRIYCSLQSLKEAGNSEIKRDTGTLKLVKEDKKLVKDYKQDEYFLQQGVACHLQKQFIWTKKETNKEYMISVDLAAVYQPPYPGTGNFLGRKNVGYFVVPFKSILMIKRRYVEIQEDNKKNKKELLETAFVKTFVVEENKRVRNMECEYHNWFVCYVLMKYFTYVENEYTIFTFETDGTKSKMGLKSAVFEATERQTHISNYNWKTMALRKVYEDKEDYDSVWECFNRLTEPFLTSNPVKIPYLGDRCIEEIIYVTDKDGQPTPQVTILKEIRQILERVSKGDIMKYEEFKKEIMEVVPKRPEN